MTVTTGNATSTSRPVDQFTYLAAAAVSAVSSTEATGAYTTGAVISITVAFDEQVGVTGSPKLTLNANGATAVYSGGSGGSTLTFTYTVAAGQNSSDLDYTSISALGLNGGTIDDTAGTAAQLALPAPGTDGLATRNIAIETTAPVVTGLSSTVAAGTYEAGAAIPITVSFSEAVWVTVTAGKPQLALNAGGSAAASYSGGSGTSTLTFTYIVAVGQSSADLDYTSPAALALDGGNIQDAVGTAAVLTLPATGVDGLATQRIVVDSAPPTVATAASARSSQVTGTTVSLSVLGSDVDTGEASLKYNWRATTVPTGAAPPTFGANGTNAAKNSTATFRQAGNYIFTVTITDPFGLTVASSVPVTVDQTLTTIAMGPLPVSLNLTATQQFTATAKDQFGTALWTQPTFTWTTTLGTITAGGMLTAPDAPTKGTVTASSGSLHGTAAVTVLPTGMLADPILPGKTDLYVYGAAGNQAILVKPGTVAGSVSVEINGKLLGTYDPTGRIVIYGGAGSDYLSVSSQVTLPAWLYAGGGTDMLVGGGGPNFLFGGAGNDTLYGGKGRNILIAGAGKAHLMGGAGDGLLIGGTTLYDANDLALQAIMNEWNSCDACATRIACLTGTAGGLNGSYYLDSATVTGGASDTLVGGNANDVFFQAIGEKVLDRRANEVARFHSLITRSRDPELAIYLCPNPQPWLTGWAICADCGVFSIRNESSDDSGFSNRSECRRFVILANGPERPGKGVPS